MQESVIDRDNTAVAEPPLRGDLAQDGAACAAYWRGLDQALAALPPKPARSGGEQRQAEALLAAGRGSREAFLAQHARTVYDRLTAGRSRFLRLDELLDAASRSFPGLVPGSAQLERERPLRQSEKDGLEILQGLFLAHMLADPACGAHLCHAMLLPHPKSEGFAAEFARSGKLDLGKVRVERRGRAAIITLHNDRYLNAEDDTTLDAQEIATDVCLMDPDVLVGVLRGGEMSAGKYQGRRVYCTGINLTRLYYGQVPYLWYVAREMGFVNKLFRGLASPGRSPDELLGETQEKVFISAIEAFAIGGGCQYLLATDVNIAESGAYLTLPAKKEGIIPGCANLRLPRFVGDRVARQAVMMDRRIDCDSEVGRQICDRIVPAGGMGDAIDQVVEEISKSGVVSAGSNRRAFRIAHEPLDLFRRYIAMYAKEQAYCHFSPALVSNLERFWDASNRRLE